MRSPRKAGYGLGGLAGGRMLILFPSPEGAVKGFKRRPDKRLASANALNFVDALRLSPLRLEFYDTLRWEGGSER
jgi:hypothetical protein